MPIWRATLVAIDLCSVHRSALTVHRFAVCLQVASTIGPLRGQNGFPESRDYKRGRSSQLVREGQGSGQGSVPVRPFTPELRSLVAAVSAIAGLPAALTGASALRLDLTHTRGKSTSGFME